MILYFKYIAEIIFFPYTIWYEFDELKQLFGEKSILKNIQIIYRSPRCHPEQSEAE